jgi:hypothetical protein
MPLCKKCGEKIEKPYRYCDSCNDAIAAKQGQLLRRARGFEKRLKAAADASGNARIWTADQCTQEELRKLIPR